MNDDVLRRVLGFLHPSCENKLSRAEILLKLLYHVQAEIHRIYRNTNSEFLNTPLSFIDLKIHALSINCLYERGEDGFYSEYRLTMTPKTRFKNERIIKFSSISKMFEYLRSGYFDGRLYFRHRGRDREVDDRANDRVLDQLIDQISHMVLVLLAVYTPRSEPRLEHVNIIQTQSSMLKLYKPRVGRRRVMGRFEPIVASLRYGKPIEPINWKFAIVLDREFIGDTNNLVKPTATTLTYVDRKTPLEFHDTIAQLVRKFSPQFLHCLSEKSNPPALQRSDLEKPRPSKKVKLSAL